MVPISLLLANLRNDSENEQAQTEKKEEKKTMC